MKLSRLREQVDSIGPIRIRKICSSTFPLELFYGSISVCPAKEVHVRFCKRRGVDEVFLMVNLPAVSVFTSYLFWVKVPLSQHRSQLH